MKKILLCLVLLSIFTCSISEAKDTKKGSKKSSPYIKGFGWGLLGDLGTAKPYAEYNSYSSDTNFIKVHRPFAISILYFGWNSHFILKEISNEKSLSINFYPTVGLGGTVNKFLNLTFPLMLCYNAGNVSTYSSKKSTGFTFGLGAEFIKAGIITTKDESEYSEIGFASKVTSILEPCANIGLRYFTSGGHAQELNIKFGMRSDKVYDKLNKMPVDEKKTYTDFWFRFSWVHYIRY